MIYRKISFFKENPERIEPRNGVVCDGCGDNFERVGSEIKGKILRKFPHAYCTFRCYINTVSKLAEIECHNCQKKMQIKPAVLRASRRHFCSGKCQGAYQTKISIASELLKILDFDVVL